MRKVALSHPAGEQLLELVTLDVYAGRRSLAHARALSSLFDDMLFHLSKSALKPKDFGRASRFFFGLLKHRNRRVMHHRLTFGTLHVTVQFDDSANRCTIESIDLV